MQGYERAGRQLLDAEMLAGHLVPAGSMFAFLAAHRAEVFPDADYADLLLPVTEMSDEGGVQGADVGMFEGPAAGVAVGPWW